MSLLNKKNVKELALFAAEKYDPEKTRISADYIKQIENIVACVTVEMVRQQGYTGMTLKDTDWGASIINQAKSKITKLEPTDYLHGS